METKIFAISSIFAIAIATTASGHTRDLAKAVPIPSRKALAGEALLSSQPAGSFSKNDISEAQLELRDLALYDGPLDGVIGPQMKEALARFQKYNGLEETGTLDPLTMVAMFGNIGTSNHYAMPSFGSNGSGK